MKPYLLPLIAVTLALAMSSPYSSAHADDWPQWLGPNRDNTLPGETIADTWPPSGPKRVWSIPVGQGFASPVIADGRLILFHRLDDQDTVDALNPETGRRLWRHQYPSRFLRSMVGDRGPRSAPTIHRGRVYTYGAQGVAHCLDLQTGAVIWSVDTAERFDTDPGFFGRQSAPLIHQDLVLLNVGGKNNAGIVALSLSEGQTVWTGTDHEASYSSPVLFRLGGQAFAAFFTRAGLVVLDPASGAVHATRPFRSPQDASVNAATPVVHDGQIFITASYNAGAALLRFTGDQLLTAWSNDQTLSSQYATPLLHDGYLYGTHGRVDFASDQLRCVEFATGRVAWVNNDVRNASVLLAGDKLLILSDTGELTLARPSHAEFQALAQASVLGRDGRAAPALSDGFLYARDQKQLICLDLRPAR